MTVFCRQTVWSASAQFSIILKHPKRSIEGSFRVRFFLEFVQTSRPASARAVYRAREGIGGRNTKSIVQTKSAADARPSRRRRRRRPTRGFVGTSPRILPKPKKRATTGRPYKIRVKSVRKIEVNRCTEIMPESFQNTLYFATCPPAPRRGDQWSPAGKQTYRTYYRPIRTHYHKKSLPYTKEGFFGTCKKINYT